MPEFLQLAPQFQLAWYQWSLALLSIFILGLAKSGLKGVDVIVVTLMALVFGSKASTGIIVPMLVMGDIFAVSYYHRHTQWRYLLRLLPWMMGGVLVATWVGQELPEDIFRQAMAGIILFSVAMMYWMDRRKPEAVPDNLAFAGFMGFGAGFTTMIGNLAGAFANILFLAMRLPKDQFIGTAAWLFFIVNLFKLPFHIFVWETITPETLALNLRLAPAILVGLFVGVRVVKVIREKGFRQMIFLLTAIGAVLILFR